MKMLFWKNMGTCCLPPTYRSSCVVAACHDQSPISRFLSISQHRAHVLLTDSGNRKSFTLASWREREKVSLAQLCRSGGSSMERLPSMFSFRWKHIGLSPTPSHRMSIRRHFRCQARLLSTSFPLDTTNDV